MQYSFGPLLDDTGTTFRLWAPSQPGVNLLLENRQPLAMARHDNGIWSVRAEGVGAGTRYRFNVDGYSFPDPASRQQSTDVESWSIVRAPFNKPRLGNPLHPWHQSIICEVHIGTVTPEGTFKGLMQRLEHFRDAGYTTLEIMPIAEFPGQRNWGYDGVLLYAPDAAYGTPDDLRALVDRAHELGLCIVLDVVYNHFGNIENDLPRYAPEFFTTDIKTPWGAAIDVRQPLVRQFFYENACMWLSEYDLDGLRFDAIHEIATEDRDLFLGELAKACREVKPGAKLVIENIKNQMHWLIREEDGTPRDYTAQWNDDFHHVLNFMVTGEKSHGYEDESRDPVADLEKSLADGFVHDGDADGHSDGRTRNEPASRLPMEAFVSFFQNHDQIGNRPDSSRVPERTDADRLDFGHFITILNPQVPLLFMGEEAHLRRPFPFFFDMPEPEATQKAEGRYREMREIFHEDVKEGQLPDPRLEETFLSAKLDWDAYGQREHQEALARFRELTVLRRELIWPLSATRNLNSWSARQGDGLIITWQYEAGTYNMVLNPTGVPQEVTVSFGQPAASTGYFQFIRGGLRLGPWSALVWLS